MNQKVIIESLAMDLKRAALGTYRGSSKMANRFKDEAFARADELENQKKDKYLEKLLNEMRIRLSHQSERFADDALMLSTLFQNIALREE